MDTATNSTESNSVAADTNIVKTNPDESKSVAADTNIVKTNPIEGKSVAADTTVKSNAADEDPDNPAGHALAALHKSVCGSVNSLLPEIEPDIIYPLEYANDPFLKNMWEITLTNLKNASKPLEILEAIASTAMMEGYVAKFATSILEGVINDNDMRDMLVSGIKTYTTTQLATLSLGQYAKVSQVIRENASSPDLAMLMIQQLGKAMVKPDAKAIRNQLKKQKTGCDEEAEKDEAAAGEQKTRMAAAEEAKVSAEKARVEKVNADLTKRKEKSEKMKSELKEQEEAKKQKKLEKEREAKKNSYFNFFSSETKENPEGKIPEVIGVPVEDDAADAVVATVVDVPEATVVNAPTKMKTDSNSSNASAPPAETTEIKDLVDSEKKEIPTSTDKIPTNAEEKEIPTNSIDKIQTDTEEKKVTPEINVGGRRTRRPRQSARKTRKHWLLFTLRDIL